MEAKTADGAPPANEGYQSRKHRRQQKERKNPSGWRAGRAPAWAQQRLVQDVGAVGAGEHDNALGGREAVHLHQQLVQRVLALVVAAREAAAPARAPNRVNLVCAQQPAPAAGVSLAQRETRMC
jgi:hypothetical protein